MIIRDPNISLDSLRVYLVRLFIANAFVQSVAYIIIIYYDLNSHLSSLVSSKCHSHVPFYDLSGMCYHSR